MDVSVVVPLFNEEESLPELVKWIKEVENKTKLSCEIVLIDDGSSDASWDVILQLSKEYTAVKGIKFRRNYGKSAALYSGFEAAEGDVVITMDADLQDSPEEIPGLYKMIMEEDYDMVSGWKKKRYDPFSKTFPSKFFNWSARKVTGIVLNDFNCGLKAYKKKVIKCIEVYGEMHRYIPVLAKAAGFNKIGEKVVQHQERQYGVSKFGFERGIKGMLDLLSVSFMAKFSKRPMHLFGALGSIMFIAGVFISLWLLWEKIYGIANNLTIREITDQPLFFIGLTSIVIGVQLFLAGFIAELISRNSSERNFYQIEDKVNV